MGLDIMPFLYFPNIYTYLTSCDLNKIQLLSLHLFCFSCYFLSNLKANIYHCNPYYDFSRFCYSHFYEQRLKDGGGM